MPAQLPPCPECGEFFTYETDTILACPMCGHEWTVDSEQDAESGEPVIRDAVGNILADGDTVTIVRDVQVKGAGGGTIKSGTKVPNIRLIDDGVGDHDIDARVPGFGTMQLKSGIVKKIK